jgi:hypothetical protein
LSSLLQTLAQKSNKWINNELVTHQQGKSCSSYHFLSRNNCSQLCGRQSHNQRQSHRQHNSSKRQHYSSKINRYIVSMAL